MFISGITDGGATPALIKTLAFNEARLEMLAENMANYGTPNYRTRQLDAKGFQRALRDAFDDRGDDKSKPFVVQSGREVSTDDFGYLKVAPSFQPVQNILSHDGTNASIERQMADLAETTMMHDMVATLLRGYFEGPRKAIRGHV